MNINNTEKQILKYLLKKSNYKNRINLEDIQHHFKFDNYIFDIAIDKLQRRKLIDGTYDSAFITDDGISYFKIRTYNIIKFIITSLVIPIVVAIITSKLTTTNNKQCCNNTNYSRNQTFDNK